MKCTLSTCPPIARHGQTALGAFLPTTSCVTRITQCTNVKPQVQACGNWCLWEGLPVAEIDTQFFGQGVRLYRQTAFCARATPTGVENWQMYSEPDFRLSVSMQQQPPSRDSDGNDPENLLCWTRTLPMPRNGCKVTNAV